MVRRKSVRERGKLPLSSYFKELKVGDKVSIVRERAIDSKFPKRLQGCTGKVVGNRGRSYIIAINDREKPKKHIIAPIHLKKIK
jgi:large subunit ribosomal protein L21e